MQHPTGSVVAVLDSSVQAQLIQASLPAGTALRVTAFGQGLSAVVAALEEASPDLVLVGVGEHADGAIDVIQRTRALDPSVALVVLHTGSPNGLMERAFQAGADDLIAIPQTPDSLAFAIQKAVTRCRGVMPQTATGTMICILGPKGGTGKTLVACNLGVALAMQGKRAVVVDADLQFGDIGIALGLTPERTMYDLALSGGEFDEDKLDRFLLPHSSALRVLLAPTRPDQAGAIEITMLRDVYTALRRYNDFVIIDTPPAFSAEVIASIDSASELCVVGMLDALSLKDTKIGLETLALMGYDPGAVTLVLNRADTNVGISHADVEHILGRRPDVLIPSDRAIPRAITDGLTIVAAEPASGAARAFNQLAGLYLGKQAPAETRGEESREAVESTGRRVLFRKAR